MSETPSFPGWYITFQTDVLSQLPRPGEIEQEIAVGWHDNRQGLKRALAETLVPLVRRDDLLQVIGTITTSATTSEFITKEKFVINTERNGKVLISYLGDNFKEWFLSGDGKTESPIGEQTLRYHKLRRLSMDGPIISELGGEAKSETTLSEMFSLMERQKYGENGIFLRNGWANIFYIKDQSGVLRTVFVFWHGDAWGVDAESVLGLYSRGDGRHVFSRLPASEAREFTLESSETSVPAKA